MAGQCERWHLLGRSVVHVSQMWLKLARAPKTPEEQNAGTLAIVSALQLPVFFLTEAQCTRLFTSTDDKFRKALHWMMARNWSFPLAFSILVMHSC